MIHLEKINGENIWDILNLNVSDSQKNFVASNDISIIEAYTAITSNGYAFPPTGMLFHLEFLKVITQSVL